MGERQGIALLKGVRAIDPENPQLEMAKILKRSVVALPGRQPISVNTFLCDTWGLAEYKMQAVKCAVAKLHGNKIASLCMKLSYKVTNQHPAASQSFMELCDPLISGPLFV